MIRVATALALVLASSTAYAQTSMPAQTTQERAGEYVVFFRLGATSLDAEAQREIAAAAETFRRTGGVRVAVRGHTDTTGSAQRNQALSERRADAVARALEQQGVPESAITATGVGESDLLVQTGDNVSEPRNRRAEIDVQEPAPAPAATAAPAPMASSSMEEHDRPGGLTFGLGGLYGFNMEDNGNNDKSSHLAGLNLTMGYGLTDWVELELEQAVFYNFLSDNDGVGGRSAGGVNFTLGRGTVIPYVGGNVGYLYGSGINDDFFAGPEIGLEIGPIAAKVAYDMPFNRDVGDGVIMATIGLGLRF